jgi:hypothetical protein
MTGINDELGIYVNHVMVNDWAKWRHDIRHNDIQNNDIQHRGLNYDTQHK